MLNLFLNSFWYFLTRGGGAVGQFLILADKGGRGGLQTPIFGWHHMRTSHKGYIKTFVTSWTLVHAMLAYHRMCINEWRQQNDNLQSSLYQLCGLGVLWLRDQSAKLPINLKSVPVTLLLNIRTWREWRWAGNPCIFSIIFNLMCNYSVFHDSRKIIYI